MERSAMHTLIIIHMYFLCILHINCHVAELCSFWGLLAEIGNSFSVVVILVIQVKDWFMVCHISAI